MWIREPTTFACEDFHDFNPVVIFTKLKELDEELLENRCFWLLFLNIGLTYINLNQRNEISQLFLKNKFYLNSKNLI